MKSRIALIACYLLILGTAFLYYPKWKMGHTEATISWDVSGYYFYLPATFIYKDLKKVDFKEEIQRKYRPASGPYQTFTHESGSEVMKYSLGLAVQYTPFFLVAHGLAPTLGYPADGFSRPYQVAISMGSLLIALLGLWLLRKVLLNYFSDGTTAITLLTIAFASNYLNYSAIDGAMSHNWLFTIYTLLIWQSIKFYESPSPWRGLLIGITVGIAALTRPTEVIACIIPLLWGTNTLKDIINRIQFFFSPKGILPILLAGIGTLAVGSLQLIYWKYVSGDWIVYSYQDQGFSWLHPHLMDAMFSYRAGWLTYTPVMTFALLGFIVLIYQRIVGSWESEIGSEKSSPITEHSAKQIGLIPILLFSLLFMYITFAWDIWWYGGSLGQRAMVQAYPILAFPLAAFLSLAEGRNWLKVILIPLFLFFTIYNIWLTHQAHKGGLFMTEQMTEPYFKAIFLRSEVSSETIKLLDTDELFKGTPQNTQIVLTENYESDTTEYNCPIEPIEGKRSFCLSQEMQFSPLLQAPVQKRADGWVRITATFRSQQKEWDVWRMAQLQARFLHQGQIVKDRAIRVFRLLDPDSTQRIYIDIKMPNQDFDTIAMQLWNADSNKTLAVDEVEITVFEEE